MAYEASFGTIQKMRLNLENYQQLMHDHLIAREQAAAFVGVGLGKTATTLMAFRTLLAEGATKAMLVIAPLRVSTLTWPNEIRKWSQFQGLKVENLRNNGDVPSGKSHIYLTNPARLLKTVKVNGEYQSVPRLTDLSFCDTVVIDELTCFKNPASAQGVVLRSLAKNHRKWGLTGTPRPNSPLELFSQVRLLDDGKRLGPSFDAFKRTWFDPDFNEYNWVPKPDAERKIYERIHDLVITLRSSDYLNIADTVVEDIEVPLPKAAHAIYRELERELMILIEDKEVIAVNAAVLVNKLLQICGGAIYSADNERTVVEIHQSKIVALKRLLLDLDGESALVACNYIHERERICQAIPGAVDASKFKGDIEDAWNSGRIKILVADPRSLGHGLNLQAGGRNVIWFSPCWSRELYDQFNGRVARKGQELVPRVYRLSSPGTMDDAAIETLRVRGDSQNEMMAVLTNFRTQGLCFA